MSDQHQEHRTSSSLIKVFSTHRVASNLLMSLIILVGVWALKHLNTQFFPSFERDVLMLSVAWPGASAEDVQQSITIPIEYALKGINGIEKIFASSSPGSSSIRLEVEKGSEPGVVIDDVRQAIDGIRNWPVTAEEAVVQQLVRYEAVAKVLVTGTETLAELRPLVYQLEQSLLDRGIRRVDFKGLPDNEMSIQVPSTALHELGLTLSEVAERVEAYSQDLPVGTSGRNDGARQVRSLGQARDLWAFEQLPLLVADNRIIRLGDVADIERRLADNKPTLSWQGHPAVELTLQRTSSDDTLEMASVLTSWLEEVQPELPEGITLLVYQESWTYLNDRIELLLKNGVGGLVLVIAALLLFLNVRVAFWVAVGIPVSLLAALTVMWLLGGSINLISLFGLIMAIGIIVDDSIVVGENTLARLQQGQSPEHAAWRGAQSMLAPVLASSLTTIAAFLPLLILDGNVGNILIDIPTIVICVIIASLIECFLILPGHLHHSLKGNKPPGQLRCWLDSRYELFREKYYRRWLRLAIRHRGVTVTGAFCLFCFSIALLMSKHLPFTFFPSIDGETLRASVQFAAGTSRTEVDRFLDELERALYESEETLGSPFVRSVVQQHRQALFGGFGGSNPVSDESGALQVEVISADRRPFTNAEILAAWRRHIQSAPGIERLALSQRQAGPPGKAIELKLIGDDPRRLKEAALALQEGLVQFVGVSNVEDGLPFGREQLIFSLTPVAQGLGLTLESVGRQLRAALAGQRVQIFHDSNQEIEVKVQLPERERNYLGQLYQLPLVLDDGRTVLLENMVEFTPRPGIDRLQRIDGRQSVVVNADVDEKVANANEIMAMLEQDVLPQLKARYGVKVALEGRSQEQAELLADMQLGLVLALLLIYGILCWVFASYSWPLVVMLAIPFGVTGALLGHWLTGMNLTVMSLFGMFGLSGIVINDSIVLLTFYHKLRRQGLAIEEAITEAGCQRLRAVLLTSITTICGLLPILFETSLQAQFLIPMATSIVFGLAFGTVLILLVVPAMLVFIEYGKLRISRILSLDSAVN